MGTHHDKIDAQCRLYLHHSLGRVAGRDQKFMRHASKLFGSYFLESVSASFSWAAGVVAVPANRMRIAGQTWTT